MNLNGTLNIGVSGLLTQSTKISTISDNISNVNTVGYKGFTTDFLSLVQGSSNFETNNGARANSHYNSLQGLVTPTDSTTDIAINGNGYFTVTADNLAGSKLLYTRAGTFAPDQDGNMRNSAGFYLQGWRLDPDGALPAGLQNAGYSAGAATSNLQLVNVAALDNMSAATGHVAVKANLDADQALYNPPGAFTFAANPSPGDSLTINGASWTFVASGATGNQTNIGQTLDLTITQLAKDLEASTNPAITPATYSNIGGNQLKILYDSTNAGAPAFTLASSSINVAPTQLLIYNPTLAASNMTSGNITSQFNRAAKIVDNNGIEHDVKISFLKTAVNSWAVELSSVPASNIRTPGGQIAAGSMTFNGDGTLRTVSPSLTAAINFPWTSTGTTPADATTATADSSVIFNWGTAGEVFGTSGSAVYGQSDGMRQLASDYIVNSLLQDGHASGSLQSVQIADDGLVTGFYTNGATQSLYKIPLAKFINPDGLDYISGTVFADSESSGLINYFASGEGGVGEIESGALENSNVDLAFQLTDIIIAQRAYQVNTKTITTSDEMLQNLTDMIR